ncbi:MAG: ribosome biogenesis GTPase Der [Clostridia bacterium]|nr:ribosome biogenesis GTPase Der [Clostridia bacterium]MBQ9997696.1 ribosome biogenesis GTPase Der [Clostridia bacterium]
MAKPIVAVVGRPNVGKSTLFNKIIGKRLSIVADTPGVTRDRIYADAEWAGKQFKIVDTGGIEPTTDSKILTLMREQADIAIETADVIIFVVDVKEGVTAADKDVATMLRKSGKPIVLACNKCDAPGEPPLAFYDFYNLAIGEPIAVSSVHGMGFGDMLDAVTEYFDSIETTDEEEGILKIAVVGRPNAGKSSFVNKMLGEERLIVSPIAGTTRDSIDTIVTVNGEKFMIIDTAGMRKRGKVEEEIERYSVIRSLSSIDRADVAVLMIDATDGVTEQDTKIAGYIHENGKACLVAVNKWDLIEKETNTMDNFRKEVQEKLGFMLYAPILFVSAKTGQRLSKIFELAKYIDNQSSMRISTGMLNDVINDATARVQPPSDKGKRLKIYYLTQTGIKPPSFVLFVNDKKLAHFSYIRYIENQLRNTFGFEGSAIKFVLREKDKN